MGDTTVNVEAGKPPVVIQRPRAHERMPWQRMALSLFGIAIIVGKERWNIHHLYTLPDATIAAFQSMTNNSNYVIGAIVVFMITGKLIYDWKNQTTTEVIQQAQTIIEKRQSHDVSEHTERIIEEVGNANHRENREE